MLQDPNFGFACGDARLDMTDLDAFQKPLYSPTSFSLNFAQSSGTQSIRSSMPHFFASLVIWSTLPPAPSRPVRRNIFKASGRDELEQSGRLSGRVPESVWQAPRLENVAAARGLDYFVADPGADFALEDM